MTTGSDFYYEFTLANPDFSPVDLTNFKFHGALQKHPGAVNANSEFHEEVGKKFITRIVEPLNGIYSIQMSANDSDDLSEGKYVYQVLMTDDNGRMQPAVSGLVFVDKGFGILRELVIDGGRPGDIVNPDTVIVDGGTPTNNGSGPNIDGGYI